MSGPRVGILGLQGDVEEHVAAFARLGVSAAVVKSPSHLERVEALVIPGGESTTVIRLLERSGLDVAVRTRVSGGMPLWGTCMGMIVTAREVAGLDQDTLALLDVTVRRNAFGRQIESAERSLEIPILGKPPFPAVFIRAPWIERWGPQVQILASVDGHPVFVRERSIMATSFHPELTGDDRVHRFFLSLLAEKQESDAILAES